MPRKRMVDLTAPAWAIRKRFVFYRADDYVAVCQKTRKKPKYVEQGKYRYWNASREWTELRYKDYRLLGGVPLKIGQLAVCDFLMRPDLSGRLVLRKYEHFDSFRLCRVPRPPRWADTELGSFCGGQFRKCFGVSYTDYIDGLNVPVSIEVKKVGRVLNPPKKRKAKSRKAAS